MRWSFAIVAALVLAAPVSAAAATKTGRSSEGARFTLSGRVVTIVLPSRLPPRARVTAECGCQGRAGKTTGEGSARGRGLRTVRVRLRGGVGDAEWCRYRRTQRRFGAAQLTPGVTPPERLRAGPGVRQAVEPRDARDPGDDVRFLQRGSVVTADLATPFVSSRLVGIACGRGYEALGFRTFAARAGQHVFTADLEADVSGAEWCLVEQHGGEDVASATFR